MKKSNYAKFVKKSGQKKNSCNKSAQTRPKSKGMAMKKSREKMFNMNKSNVVIDVINTSSGGNVGDSTEIENRRKYYENLMRTIEFFDKQSDQSQVSKKKSAFGSKEKTIVRNKKSKGAKMVKSREKCSSKELVMTGSFSKNCGKKSGVKVVAKVKSPAIKVMARKSRIDKPIVGGQVAAAPVAPPPVPQTASDETDSSNPTYNLNEEQMLDLFKQFLRTVSKDNYTKETRSASKEIAKQSDYVTDMAQLEELHDEMSDLLMNTNTIHDSYQSIVQSLVNLQKHRRNAKTQTLLPGSMTKMTGKMDQMELQHPEQSRLTINDLQDIELFLNCGTRDVAFNELFNLINSLKEEMAPFCQCFDQEGYLIESKYSTQMVNVGQLNSWKQKIHDYSKVVENILKQYNKDVLELFRISQVSQV